MSDRPALAACAPQVAEFLHRRTPRLGRRHASRHQFALAHRQMELELRVDFLVYAWAPEAQGKAGTKIH